MLVFTLACKDQDGSSKIPTEINLVNTSTGSVETVVSLPEERNLSVSEEFMELVNDHRNSLGLRPLINDEEISKIAQVHSDNMASGTVSFGHTGFADRCTKAREAMGGGNLCGENVARGQKDAAAVFHSWMSSPGHRASIEQGRFTHSGFAFKKGPSGITYWTHLFLEHN